ncbi:LysM peptidoglycan-binding domain-containing protein [Arthrobacter halodurans]|uniref:LysM peptidoglycan-binding domain-containing protein n=1 Tax=Arthrobacter halodurans TaxID=516699 RepID=A0ABV4UJS8_9MICC
MTTLFRDAAACGATGALGVVLAASGAVLLADAPARALWGVAVSPASAERWAALALSACGIAVLLWWALAWCAAFAAALLARSGRPARARRLAILSPASMRRVAAAVVGAQLALAPAAQAQATSAHQPSASIAAPIAVSASSAPHPSAPHPSASDDDGAAPPDPGWRPERPAATLDRILGGGRADRASGPAGRELVVLAGDSLWSIADRTLGGLATDAEIAREWPRWYHANREAIGADPDLLAVGTVLYAPAA